MVFLFSYMWEFLWGLLVFYAKDASGYTGIVWNVRRVFSGRIIPLDLLPVSLFNFLMLLPFANGYFLPIQFMMGDAGVPELFDGMKIIVVWTACLWVVANFLWKKAVKQFEGVGI